MDLNVLKEEAEEGRRLGFDGKVRIVTVSQSL
jgi:citrate lyase beta subunit